MDDGLTNEWTMDDGRWMRPTVSEMYNDFDYMIILQTDIATLVLLAVIGH